MGVIKPTDKIALGSYIEDIEEMHKKQTDGTWKLLVKGVSKDKTINKIDKNLLTENN